MMDVSRRHGVALVAYLALLAGPAGAGRGAMSVGVRGDGVLDLFVGGRDLIVRTDGATINGFILTSAAGLLSGEPYALRLGLFVTDADPVLADQFGYGLDGLHDFGRVLGEEHSLEQLQQDLTLTYTVAGQAGVYAATILPAWPGDCDVDGDVDRDDFLHIEAGAGGPGSTWVTGDFDGNGRTDFVDYLTWKANVGLSPPKGADVPEPGTLLLVAMGGVALLRRRCFSKRTRAGFRAKNRKRAWFINSEQHPAGDAAREPCCERVSRP